MYRQIADGVRAATLDGRLPPGHRLPATRDFARSLGVNRNTVVAAYACLADEGWVTSHTGKGTFVAARHEEAPAKWSAADSWSTAFSRAVEGPSVGGLLSMFQQAIATGGISFSGSYPAPELMPVEPFGRAIAAALRDGGARTLGYGPTAGHPLLREWIAGSMRARGSSVDPETILITNGAQQAIDLVFHTFLERGDAAVIEEPTYTGALSVLASLGARVIAVQCDEQGIRPDLLAVALERHHPRLIYVQPTFQNPTTGVLGEERRRELLELAARHRCVVVEDDWGAGLRYEGGEPPTLHALDGGRQVIYLSTFSKKLVPGLRIGWVAAPPRVMQRLVALKQIRDCGTSPVLQAALDLFLREGGLDDHLRHVLPAYRERRDSMLRALERHFPAEAHWTRPEGGLFVWVTLPRGFDGAELYWAAQQERVHYSRGEVFHSKGEGSHTLRLTFSAVSPSEVEAGVATLGGLIGRRWPERTESTSSRTLEAVPIL